MTDPAILIAGLGVGSILDYALFWSFGYHRTANVFLAAAIGSCLGVYGLG